MTDSTCLYYKGRRKIIRLYDGIAQFGFPMPACDDGPRCKANDLHEAHGEWADKHGSFDRQHTDLGVGSSQYFTWVKYLQAYIQRQPPPASGYYPDSEIFLFIDNGNSYCYGPGAASIKKNV